MGDSSKCGTMRMKTTRLANKSRRPHNFRTTKVISTQLVSYILKIRQAEPMYGKEKIKRELEKDNIFVSVSTVGRVLKYLMEQNKIQNIHLIKKEIVISENSQACTLCRTNPETKAKQPRRTNTNRPHGFKFIQWTKYKGIPSS